MVSDTQKFYFCSSSTKALSSYGVHGVASIAMPCCSLLVLRVPAHAHIAQPAGHRPYDSVAQEPLHSEDALGQVQEKSQFYHPQKEIFRDREALAIRAEAG